MVLTASTRANLHQTTTIYRHRHHWRSADRAIQGAVKFHITMWANKGSYRICGDIKLAGKIVTTIQAGEPEPSLPVVIGYNYQYRWLTVNGKGLIFQAMIAMRTIYIDWEDSLIILYPESAISISGIL